MADLSAELQQALAGRYLIERELGQGGMATVYLAADLKHPRKVAIKVLRADLAAVIGAERFVQEIRVASALQHPHILGLIDSGIVEGLRGTIPYYVMPYVEGESLRARLSRETQLPVGNAIAIATAVASALDYAHRHGVIHRDIKPENILLHEDHALVADFGIALAVQTAGGPRLTETGLALGTPQYMSPEQGLAAREIGPRSDVYALGCVTYEMLAGEPPFTGPTAQAIIAKAARDTPPPLRLGRPSVPASVEAAVARALERLPADRFGSAGEFATALTDGAIFSGGVRAPAGDGERSWRMRMLALLGAVAVGVALGLVLRPSHSAPVQRVTRFEITLPPDISSRENFASRIALAPDGSSIVYLGITDGIRHLFVRRLDQTTAQPLPGTEGGSAPFYSPDGSWVGFMAGSEMRKVPLGGGPPVRITTWSGIVTGASWGDRGDIVFSSWKDRGLWRVSAGGGTPEPLIGPDSTTQWLTDPDFLPGGANVLVSMGNSGAGVVNIRSGRITPLAVPGGRAIKPRYAGNDWLVFDGEAGVAAVRLDPVSLQIRGARRPLQISAALNISALQVAVSREGTLIYVARKDTEEVSLVLVDRFGVAVPLADKAARFSQPRFSPDGRLVAVAVGGQANESDLWIYGAARPSDRRLTFNTPSEYFAWSADGTRVTYSTNGNLMSTRADGAGSSQPMPMRRVSAQFLPSTWTPDGKHLIASEAASVSGDIWRIPADSMSAPHALFQTPFFEFEGSVSPDGRWLAYTSNETGQWEVWVREFPGMDGQTMVSIGGGLMPVWDRSGKELYYRSGNRLYSATVAPGTAFSVGERTMLFDAPQLRSARIERDYDVGPDGKHFVMLRRADPLERLQVILNWDREFPPDK